MLYTYNVLHFSACHANTCILTAFSLLQAELRRDDPLALGVMTAEVVLSTDTASRRAPIFLHFSPSDTAVIRVWNYVF
jgi:hypothetical protein